MKQCKNIEKLEVGIDECGRGPLFGRVYVASVILPDNFRDYLEDEGLVLRDSKKVSEKKRNRLREYIEAYAIDYNVSYAESTDVDKYNILRANLRTMHKSLNQLIVRPDSILVDGDRFIEYGYGGKYIEHHCIIGGDDKYDSIAAASILAKTYRDEYIIKLCEERPELLKYGLDRNKGYGTKQHLDAIKEHGLQPEHRRTFGICKFLFKQSQEALKKENKKHVI
jgi:ribonuclease HII